MINHLIQTRPQKRPQARQSKLGAMAMLAGAIAGAACLVPAPAQAETPAQLQRCGDAYEVRRGDWLSTIAARCNVPVDDVVALNPDIDPNLLEVGQRLVLREAEPVEPTMERRFPMVGLPPAPPQNGPVELTGEVTDRRGACLYVTDAAGRRYSMPAGNTALTRGAWVTVSGEVVDNWFCADGAEILVETLAPAEAARMAGLGDAAL